jgi:IS30 family transposase
MSKQRTDPWTPEERERARMLRKQGLKAHEIGKSLGRSAFAVYRALNISAEKPRRRDFYPMSPKYEPTPEQIADRDKRRFMARPDFTSEFFGDPLPGYSAKDAKRGR